MWKKFGKGALQFLGIFAAFTVVLGVIVTLKDSASAAGETQVKIGFVDMQDAMKSHPKTEKSLADLKTYAQAQNDAIGKELETEAKKIMGAATSIDQLPEDKQSQLLALREKKNDEFNQRVQDKDSQLTAPIIKDIVDAAKAVATRKGINVVLDSTAVLTGGVDLTAEVITEVKKK